MAAKDKKKPTAIILYVPGGGMNGLISTVLLCYLERILETPAYEWAHVGEGVSTGAIIVAAIMQGHTAEEIYSDYVEDGPHIFPYKPNRWPKMHMMQGLNLGKIFFGLEPKKTEKLILDNISRLCCRMRKKASAQDYELLHMIAELEEAAKTEWFHSGVRKKTLKLGTQIDQINPAMAKYTNAIAELSALRRNGGFLSAQFRKHAARAVDTLRDSFFPVSACLFDPEVREKIFKNRFGETLMSDIRHGSLYISYYYVRNNRAVTSSSRKKDILSDDPAIIRSVRNDMKVWDAVMATTANELAFPAHITEDGQLCTDLAPFHKPVSVSDVKQSLPDDTRVVLLALGTGTYVSGDLAAFMEEDDTNGSSLSRSQKERVKLERQRKERYEVGVGGQLILGKGMAELERNNMTAALNSFRTMLGPENVFAFDTRLAPHTPKEQAIFPSKDPLNASRDNMTKIIRAARRTIESERGRLHEFARIIADNQYLLGRMDQEKYDRVCDRIGHTARLSPKDRPGSDFPAILRGWFKGGKSGNDNVRPKKMEAPAPQKAASAHLNI